MQLEEAVSMAGWWLATIPFGPGPPLLELLWSICGDIFPAVWTGQSEMSSLV
jgi:hypothetical protein